MGKFKPENLEQFVTEHIQQKVNENELHLVGFDMENVENFKREFEIYRTALFEGICNGILMCGSEIEGIE